MFNFLSCMLYEYKEYFPKMKEYSPFSLLGKKWNSAGNIKSYFFRAEFNIINIVIRELFIKLTENFGESPF